MKSQQISPHGSGKSSRKSTHCELCPEHTKAYSLCEKTLSKPYKSFHLEERHYQGASLSSHLVLYKRERKRQQTFVKVSGPLKDKDLTMRWKNASSPQHLSPKQQDTSVTVDNSWESCKMKTLRRGFQGSQRQQRRQKTRTFNESESPGNLQQQQTSNTAIHSKPN